MRNISRILVLVIGMAMGGAVFAADSPTSALSSCLVENLSGKERKSLAKWIFFAMGAHPEIRSYSNASPKDIKDSDEYVGKLITRLLTVDCPDKLKTAYSSDPLAVRKAFELVGQVAMQELMTNQDVLNSITNYAQFADKAKINKLLSETK